MSLKIMLHGRLQEGVAEAAGSAPCSGTTPERSRRAGSNAARPRPRWPESGRNRLLATSPGIAYINRDDEAGPIAAALDSLATRPVKITFAKADLLEYHRDHRMFEWTSVRPVHLGANRNERARLPLR